jgi:transcriptional regulator with XRE-family HTH domain
MVKLGKTTETSVPGSSMGAWARSVRMALKLTQQELASMVGVSQEEVDLFEHNLPVSVKTELKIIRELWAARNVLESLQ